MSSTLGESAISAMLDSLGVDQQHVTIAKFIQNELDVEREKVALFHQQGSQQAEQLRELGAQQTELLRQRQFHAAVGKPKHTRRPESLNIDISKYRRVEEDSFPKVAPRVGRCHQGPSHRRRRNASCIRPVKLGRTFQFLILRAQSARPIRFWVVKGF